MQFDCLESSSTSSRPRDFFGKNVGGIGEVRGFVLTGDAGVDILRNKGTNCMEF